MTKFSHFLTEATEERPCEPCRGSALTGEARPSGATPNIGLSITLVIADLILSELVVMLALRERRPSK